VETEFIGKSLKRAIFWKIFEVHKILVGKTEGKNQFEAKSSGILRVVDRRGRFGKIRDSVVGIATRYGLGGRGIESRWGARFSVRVQTGPAAQPASYTMGIGSFPGVKWSGRGVDHPLLPSTEVKGRVELYIYSPLGLRDLL